MWGNSLLKPRPETDHHSLHGVVFNPLDLPTLGRMAVGQAPVGKQPTACAFQQQIQHNVGIAMSLTPHF